MQLSTLGIRLMSYGLNNNYRWNIIYSWPWKVQGFIFSACLLEEKHCLDLLNGIWWGDLSTICSLGSIPADEGSISAVQLLVVHFNDHTNSAEEVNEAVKQLFTWKGRAMVTFIPPTQAALQNKRAVGWSCLFIRCLLLHTDLIKLYKH